MPVSETDTINTYDVDWVNQCQVSRWQNLLLLGFFFLSRSLVLIYYILCILKCVFQLTNAMVSFWTLLTCWDRKLILKDKVESDYKWLICIYVLYIIIILLVLFILNIYSVSFFEIIDLIKCEFKRRFQHNFGSSM